jgi:hypothetical protein
LELPAARAIRAAAQDFLGLELNLRAGFFI